MEMRYPIILLVAIALLVSAIIFARLAQNRRKKAGKSYKLANIARVQQIPLYKKLFRKYRLLSLFASIAFVIAYLAAAFLCTRPYAVTTQESETYNRDIMLCLDVSVSVIEANSKAIQEVEKLVKQFDGERIGVTIFNVNPIYFIPMSDDYDYVSENLAILQDAFSEAEEYGGIMQSSVLYGTVNDNIALQTNTSSNTPDGLAACTYNFGENIDEGRSRSIIFVTDNLVYTRYDGSPILTLQQAANLVKKENIGLYSLAIIDESDPDFSWEAINEYKNVTESIGGQYYDLSDTSAIPQIVDTIQKTEASKVAGSPIISKVDQPVVPFIILLVSVLIATIIIGRLAL